jgi:hypothetical protein
MIIPWPIMFVFGHMTTAGVVRQNRGYLDNFEVEKGTCSNIIGRAAYYGVPDKFFLNGNGWRRFMLSRESNSVNLGRLGGEKTGCVVKLGSDNPGISRVPLIFFIRETEQPRNTL